MLTRDNGKGSDSCHQVINVNQGMYNDWTQWMTCLDYGSRYQQAAAVGSMTRLNLLVVLTQRTGCCVWRIEIGKEITVRQVDRGSRLALDLLRS